MTQFKPETGCGTLLAFFFGEIVAAAAFGYCAFTIATVNFGVLEDNAIPIAILAGFVGAFLVDRWAKSVVGDSIMFAVFSLIPNV